MRSIELRFAAFYAAQFVLLGVQLPFLSGWLDAKGFTPQAIGWLTGAGLAGRLAFGLVVARWSDNRVDQKAPLRLASFLFGFGALALPFVEAPAAIAAAVLAIFVAFGLLVPLSDIAVLRADRLGQLHYGRTRATGSFAFLCANILAGLAVARFGLAAAPALMAAAGAATLAMSLVLPVAPRAPDETAPDAAGVKALFASPVFLVFLVSAALIQGSHAAYYAFSHLHWTGLGYSPRVIGFLWAAGVVAEIVALTKVRAVLRRLPPTALIAIGGAGAASRWALTGAEPPLPALFLIQMMHALSFAATYVGSLEFVTRVAPPRLANTAMTAMSTLGVGAATGLLTVAAGAVYAGGGGPATYLLMTAAAAAGAVGAIFLRRLSRG